MPDHSDKESEYQNKERTIADGVCVSSIGGGGRTSRDATEQQLPLKNFRHSAVVAHTGHDQNGRPEVSCGSAIA